jgi:hypothetical protein
MVLREAVDIERRVLGSKHPDTVDSVYKLARLLALMRKPDEAISLLDNAVDNGLDPGLLVNFEKDTALKSLHGNPRFDALVAKAGKSPVAAAQKAN